MANFQQLSNLVLDFVNDPLEIQNSFQQYYQTTVLEEETDPNRLYQIQTQLSDFDVYDEEMINRFCLIFYNLDQPSELLQPILDQSVEKWRELDDEAREEFRSYLQSYIRLYAYIAQLITFQEPDWEKLYAFARCLNQKLPKREQTDVSQVIDAVDLDSIRRQMVYQKHQIELEAVDGVTAPISSDTSTVKEPEVDLLSNILQTLNDAYQTDFTEEDKVDEFYFLCNTR